MPRRPKLTTFVFFLFAMPVYASDSCSFKLEQHSLEQHSKFDQTRTFSEYLELLPAEFGKRVQVAQTWIDSGGGIGVAQREAHEHHPNLQTINITLSKIKTSAQIPQHEDRPGKLLETFAENAFQDTEIITDVFGAFAYSAQPDKVLQRFNDWLAPSGRAYILWNSFIFKRGRQDLAGSPLDQSVVITKGRKISLLEWIIRRSGMNCEISEKEAAIWGNRVWKSTSLICKKTPGAKVRALTMESATEDLPPVRTFREAF